MSDLLKRITDLTNKTIESEARTANLYLELNKAYEEIGNEKFADVSGLHVPNFHIFILDITNHTDVLKQNKFAVDLRIDEKAEKERKILIEKWEEKIKKIPQKDEFDLEGIDTWHISNYEMVPNFTDIHNPLFRTEATRLIDAGFDLAFNTDRGVGRIIVEDNGFIIELSQHMKKTQIQKGTLDEVLDWIVRFYDGENGGDNEN